MRIHTNKKITLTDSTVKVVYAVEIAEDEFITKKEVKTVSNPVEYVKQFNTGNMRLMKWEVIGTVKHTYRVNKAALEQWIRDHEIKDADPDDDDDETEGE